MSPMPFPVRLCVAAAALLPAALSFAASAGSAPLAPFHAEYATLRNGSEIGRTALDLRDNGDGSWTLRSETQGTAGLAKLAGVHVVETSRFRWSEGLPEMLDYAYRQDAAFKQRTRSAKVDWNAGQVSVVEGDEPTSYAAAPGLISRQSVTLAIAGDLLRGAETFAYKVAVRDRIEDTRYTRTATEAVTVPAGRFDAVLMQRDGEPGADRKRVARSWFAESLGWLPVQIEQTEKKGDTITLKLVSSDRARR